MTDREISLAVDFGGSRTSLGYGGAYYRPIYSGSGVYYEVVANPG
jgi:hypothetical protein